MLKHLFLAAAFLPFAVSTFAAPVIKKTDRELVMTPAELHHSAVTESTSTAGLHKTSASDAQVSGGTSTGILKLEDPGLADRNSPWLWSAGFRVQTLTPHGREKMNNGQTLDLEEIGSTIFPVISFGFERQLVKNESALWLLGLSGEAGYATQETSVTYPSGIRPTSTRLATGTVAAVATASARFAKISSVEWQASWVEGVITSSHSAPDNAVNFSRQGHFRGPRAGIAYWPTSLVSIDLNAESIRSDLDTESGRLSLGTRVTW